MIRILLIEDNPGDARLLQEILAESTFPPIDCTHVTRLGEGLLAAAEEPFDAILSDLSLPDARELHAIDRLQETAPRVPVIALTGLERQDLAREAVRRGAQDYLVKGDLSGDLLLRAITYAIERKQIQQTLARTMDKLEQRVEERTAQLEAVNQALSKEIDERKRAEQALLDLNEELEGRVINRTAAFTEVNQHLMDEIEQHRKTEDQLLRRNRELFSLQTAVAATAASLDLHFVLDTVTWEMTSLLEVDTCTIYEWEQDADLLVLVAQHPPNNLEDLEQERQMCHLADCPTRRQVLAERSTWQMGAGSHGVDPDEWARMQQAGIHAMLLIPMVFQDRVVGLIQLGSCQAGRTFTDREISLAHLLSNQAASAIENAKLYEQAQREIGRRKDAETRITASLQEKEVLLKEIHHRVKNNLQVVSSLLYLQSQSVTDPVLCDMFQDSQNRVRSMALVHERLYQTQDLARIDFAQYISDLATYLLSTYSMTAASVALEVDAEDVTLDVDTAVPCGLIVNELLSNSLKHAFPDPTSQEVVPSPSTGRRKAGRQAGSAVDDGSTIRIELHEGAGGEVLLLVADNGVGFPSGVDFRSTESLGLLLVNSLVRQLGGTVELGSGTGTEFKIRFGLS